MRTESKKSTIVILSVVVLVALGLLFVLGNKNMDRLAKEADKKITLYERVSAENVRQLALNDLREQKRYYLNMKLW